MGECPPQNKVNPPYKGVDADLFAAGVCLFVMVCRKYPFTNASEICPLWRDNFSINDLTQIWQQHVNHVALSPDFKLLIAWML